ncbi:MAG: hypothetical protein LWW82_12485 [Comamonadaceae bacterium]|nr:hypothetical protein [Comamonadaceae bacterium]
MALDYLDFDYSEDANGQPCWDAMACVSATHLPALCAEVVQLLTWAQAQFPGRQGPIDEGFDWDYELQAQTEDGQPLACSYLPHSAQLQLAPAAPTQRLQLSLTLCGSAAFGLALDDFLQP